MINKLFHILSVLLLCAFAVSCSDDSQSEPKADKTAIEKTVVVVLPMENGLDKHWRQLTTLLDHNTVTAFSSQERCVSINWEFHDESAEDLEKLAYDISAREDVYAVIGGLYSSNAVVLASTLCRTNVTLMTLATTDGKTFIDWFAFQAKELGLTVKGMHTYTEGTLKDAASAGAAEDADYVICVPSEIEDIEVVVDAFNNAGPDALAMYQLLREHGYTDDNIILIAADDIANNPENPELGVIRVKRGGDNVYTGAIIDYKLTDLVPEDFLNILTGKSTSRTPTVMTGDEGTNLFVFWSGHDTPGALCWDETAMGVSGESLREAFSELYAEKRYRKLGMFVETCCSGSVLEKCEGLPGMIFYTAANPYETSKADIYNTDLGVWMSNRFTSTLIESLSSKSVISMRDLYNRLFIDTVGSHVMVYNADNYGNLYNSSMDEFINPE